MLCGDAVLTIVFSFTLCLSGKYSETQQVLQAKEANIFVLMLLIF